MEFDFVETAIGKRISIWVEIKNEVNNRLPHFLQNKH